MCYAKVYVLVQSGVLFAARDEVSLEWLLKRDKKRRQMLRCAQRWIWQAGIRLSSKPVCVATLPVHHLKQEAGTPGSTLAESCDSLMPDATDWNNDRPPYAVSLTVQTLAQPLHGLPFVCQSGPRIGFHGSLRSTS